MAGPMPPVSGYQLITAIGVRAGNLRNQHPILQDTVGSFHHGLIVLDLKGVVLERVHLDQKDLHHLFPPRVGVIFLCGEQVIY